MRLGLLRRNGSHGRSQPPADSLRHGFDRDALFRDRVISRARLRLLDREPVESCHIGDMRRRPTVVSIGHICAEALVAAIAIA